MGSEREKHMERQRTEGRKQQLTCRLQGPCGFQVYCIEVRAWAVRGSDRGREGHPGAGLGALLQGYHHYDLPCQLRHSADVHYSLVTHAWMLGDVCMVQISGAQTHSHHLVTDCSYFPPSHREKAYVLCV